MNISLKPIAKEDINALPILRYTGAIHLIDNVRLLPDALSDLSRETLLGFDTESRPSFKKGEKYLPSLLQLAGVHAVFIFQLDKLPDLSSVFSILSNPAIQKVGVAVGDDIKRLQDLHPYIESNFSDISTLAPRLGITQVGLRSLAALLLKKRVIKSSRTSNWANTQLSKQQIQYAATDAWVSRELYLHLQQLLKVRTT